MNVHTDERRTAYCDLFVQDGQTNLFVVNPGQRTCWHRHQRQTDRFRVIRGSMVVGRWKEPTEVWYTDLTKPEQDLVVLPGWWHGYECVGQEPAYLLMYLDRKYDPTDEERASEDEVPWVAM